MPHISISLYKGRDEKELQEISKTIEESLMNELGWKSEDISVSLEEISPEDFVEEVNKKYKSDKLMVKSALIK